MPLFTSTSANSSNALSIQNPSNLDTPLSTRAADATLAKLTVAQNAALGSNTQALIGGSVTTAAPSYTTGNIQPLSLTTAGLLRVDGSGVTQPVSGTVNNIPQTSATGTLSSVAGSAVSVTLLASNASRKGAFIYNDSTSTLFLALSATASTTSYTAQVPSQSLLELSFLYTGVISGIWSLAVGNARITEMT